MNSARLSPQRLITVFAAHLCRFVTNGRRPGSMPHGRDRLHFLVIRLDQMGDTILTTPLFRELRRSFPDSRCTAIVRSAAAALLETNPNVDDVLTMPVVTTRWLPEWARKFTGALILYRQLRQGRYDVAILPRWDVELDLATFVMIIAGARATVGYSEKSSSLKMRWNAGFNRALSICVDPGPVQHEVLRSLDLVRAIGGRVAEQHLQLRLIDSDRTWAKAVLRNAPQDKLLVAIGFATNNSPSREWPLENYAEAISLLSRKYAVRAVLLSLPGEKPRADMLASLMTPPPLVVVGSGARNFAAVLERCDLFIGNDSGLAHLAAAADLPLVVISPHPEDGDPDHLNSPVRFGPFARTLRLLQPEHGRDSCVSHCSRQREAHCICSVTPERVVEAASDLLLTISKGTHNILTECRIRVNVGAPDGGMTDVLAPPFRHADYLATFMSALITAGFDPV